MHEVLPVITGDHEVLPVITGDEGIVHTEMAQLALAFNNFLNVVLIFIPGVYF